MIFVDFETDGLEGPVIDFAMVRDGVVVSQSDKIDALEPFLGQEFVIFWHYFMPSYMEKNFPELFAKMRGKFACFVDIAFYLLGKTKIEDVTFNILGRHHEGNAKQDALDLYECYMLKKGTLKDVL